MNLTTRAFLLQLFILLFPLAFVSCGKSGDAPKEEVKDKAPQPFTVSVSDISFSGATINWNAATDPEGKEVAYSVEINNQTAASNIKVTTYALTNLQNNTAYTGKVIASDPSGNKTSADFSFSTGDVPKDFTIKIDSTSNKSVYLSWSSSTIADGTVTYDLYRNNIPVASGVTATNYVFNSLQPQTSYQFKVVAKINNGQQVEKMIAGQTKSNTAPSSFTITRNKHGFSYGLFLCSGSQDADKDALSWFAVVNNVEQPITSVNNPVGSFFYTAKNLSPNQNYTVALKVKDEFGAEATSNALTFTTYQAPQNPVISAKVEGDFVVVEWASNTLDVIDAEGSYYYINGDWKGNFTSRISSQVQPDNSVLMKLKLDAALFDPGVQKTIKVSVYWGALNDFTTNSNTINFTRQLYTSTSAEVSSAVIKGPGANPPQWFIYFKNCVISDYGDNWDVVDVRFDNVSIGNFAMFPICDPTKTGYFTGNVTADQYNYLKTKNTGYVIIKDAGGQHKLNFTYTTQD